MITTEREFDTMREALEGFYKAESAFSNGYGFYPKPVLASEMAHPSNRYIAHKNGKFSFTFSRGESCD